MLIKQFSEKDDCTTWTLWLSRHIDEGQTAPYLLRLGQFLGLPTHGGRGDQMGHLRVGQDVVDLNLGNKARVVFYQAVINLGRPPADEVER